MKELIEIALECIDPVLLLAQRRQLHMYPEIGFDLPRTLELVEQELDRIGVTYTRKYGKQSIAATLGDPNATFTIGIRADMDALPIQDCKEVPYHSRIAGRAHACGHDAHTAMLLAVARGLKRINDQLRCRVMLLFQANEESFDSGARYMIEDGIMDEIDVIITAHVESQLDSGQIGFYDGLALAASRPTLIEFFGREAFDGVPQSGIDALAMAVQTYNDIQMMLSREMDPLEQYSCAVSALNAGCTSNIICGYAKMQLSIRAFSLATDERIFHRVKEIALGNAETAGGSARIEGERKAVPMTCDARVNNSLRGIASTVVGDENVVTVPPRMSGEDFSFYLEKKPGAMFLIGTYNADKGITGTEYSTCFDVDEDALFEGVEICLRFVLENMDTPCVGRSDRTECVCN